MDHRPTHQSFIKGLCLLLSLLCCCATQSWAASPSRSKVVSNRRAPQPAKAAPRLPSAAAATDPCAPAQAMETKAAAAEPSRSSTSALASLVTRAKSQQSTAVADPEHGTPLALGLWSSRVSAPDPGDDAETSLALKRLIRQLHSVTFNDKNQAQPSAPPVETAPSVQPPVPTVASAENTEPARPESAVAAAPEAAPTLSAKAQKTLENLRQNPSRVRDPLGVAELLFLSGRAADAAPFYAEALRRTGAGAASGDDRAWILFQLGNCLRETDAPKAQEAYMKLIAEFPNSPWTEMARAGGRLLTWYQSARPDRLLTPRKP
jgi:hypothetical protein